MFILLCLSFLLTDNLQNRRHHLLRLQRLRIRRSYWRHPGSARHGCHWCRLLRQHTACHGHHRQSWSQAHAASWFSGYVGIDGPRRYPSGQVSARLGHLQQRRLDRCRIHLDLYRRLWSYLGSRFVDSGFRGKEKMLLFNIALLTLKPDLPAFHSFQGCFDRSLE